VLLVGSRIKSGSEFQAIGPATENPRAVSVQPETRYSKQVMVGETQMPTRVSTGDWDAVLRQRTDTVVRDRSDTGELSLPA